MSSAVADAESFSLVVRVNPAVNTISVHTEIMHYDVSSDEIGNVGYSEAHETSKMISYTSSYNGC